jgi:YD repeat-containing protein
VTTNYSYDNLSRLLSVLHEVNGSGIDGEVYTLDNVGNRTAKQDLGAGVTTDYTYDLIYELLTATQGSTATEHYSYDPVGNRLSSLNAAQYSYNTSNEMTSNSNASYTYDANGSTVSKTDSTGTTNHTWNFDNRLTSVTLPGSGGTVSLAYDPFGRRIEKTRPKGTTVYAYDGDSIVETTDQNGNETAKYVQGLGIDEPLAMSTSGASYFYEQDGLGSVTSLIGFLKGKSAIAVARLSGKERNFRAEHFWARGYAVSTVGFELEQVRPYIREQEEADGTSGKF